MISETDNYSFHFLDDLHPPVFRLQSIGVETRATPDYTFDNRARPAAWLFQYTLAGSGTVEIDGVCHIVMPGTGFLLRLPGPEKYRFDPAVNEPWRFLFLLFDGSGAELYARRLADSCGALLELPPTAPSILAGLALYDRARQGRLTSPYLSASLTCGFLCQLCTDLLEDTQGYSALTRAACAHIARDYASPIGVGELAAALGVTSGHLSRVFHAETGQTLVQYLIRYRLQQAVRLFPDPALTIDEIAARAGFSCGNYFCKVFRRHFGQSPAAYRREQNDLHCTTIQL